MSSNGWQEHALYDLATYRNGKAFRSTELTDEGTPVIKIAELNRGISNATRYFDGTVDEKHQIDSGDLLFAWSASVGVYRWEGGPAALNQHIFKVEPKGFVDKDFLRYLLTGELPRFRRLVDDHATTMGHVKVSDLKRLTVALPPPEDQERIVAVLLPLDDKVSLNRQIAITVEAISDELFRRHFLDFTEQDEMADSEIGPIPSGWSVASLADLAEFVNGKAFTKNATGGGRMVIRIAELNVGPGPATVYNDIDVDEKHLARPGDILFAWSGSLDVYRWLRDEAIVNQHIFKVVPRGVPAWFVYQHLRAVMPEFRAIASEKATTMGHIQRHHIRDHRIAMPRPEVLDAADQVFEPLYARPWNAGRECLTLLALRDALIPKLLSGELKPRDANGAPSGAV